MSILVFALLLAVSSGPPESSSVQAFVGVTVVPMDEPRSLADRTVIVRDGRIEAILDAATPIPADAVRIDGKGKYLMPGLIDCYSHVDGTPHLVPYVASGVTTVKDSPAPIEHLGLRDRVARGELIGPTIRCSSTDLDGEPEYPTVEAITDPNRVEPIVAEIARLGYDGLMVYSGLSRNVYLKLVEAANRHDLPITGHVSPCGEIATLANGSQRSVENLVGFIDFETGAMPFAEGAARTVARMLRDGRVYCVPTLTVHKVRAAHDAEPRATSPEFRFFPESMRAGVAESGLSAAERYRYGDARRLVQIFHEEGVVVLLGTDAG
ncbi:MAG: hypothetical protein HY292_05125 [Planctomycetes bacterium]|nr:hypothetical protein [Planctomycetota bacterium]